MQATGSLNSLYTGVEMYQKSVAQATDASSRIASGRDITNAAVDLTQANLQGQAAASVIKRSDEMLGSIIDIMV